MAGRRLEVRRIVSEPFEQMAHDGTSRGPTMSLAHRRRKNGMNRPGTSKARTLLFSAL